MRKLSALIAILAIVFSGLVASPANAATPKHNIKVLSVNNTGKAWDALDVAFKKRPTTQRAWMKQGSMLSVVGFSKTATATYPFRSIATKNHGGGFYVYAVSPADHFINITDKQFAALERVLPKCKYEDSMNCAWNGKTRSNKRGEKIVNIPNSIIIAKRK